MLYIALLLTVLLGLLHFVALLFYFYWTYWWYDILMHFLAGFVGGSATYGVLSRLGKPSIPLVLAAFLIVAGAWEIFEYINGIAYNHEGYRLDTLNDLVLGVSGAILACVVGLRRERQ